LVTFQAF
ncbi:TRAP transporter, DctM subunit, partial [Vibrio parahaemolyticus V-223/04]